MTLPTYSFSQGLLGAIFPPYGLYNSFQQADQAFASFTNEEIAPRVQGFGMGALVVGAIALYFLFKNKR